MPDLFETIYAQRAIRKFKPTKITKTLIESIIDAAIRAP
ncbi:MAG TPA: nitroreductase, partial [Dehalococcoidia bacterium]|nr:nitroreductase [Dehalococcoidia bacterium]